MKLTFFFVLMLFLKWNELMRETSGKCMHSISWWYLCMQILSNYERHALHKFANFIFKLKSLKTFCILILLMLEDKTFGKNPLILCNYYNWTIWKPCNTKSFSLNNKSNMAPAKLVIGAVAAVTFLGISDRLSELCCTLEIFVIHEKLCQWVGAIQIFKTSFPVSLWRGRERREFAHVYAFSMMQVG